MKVIVIKIPEDEYNIAKYGQYGNINVDIIRKALANGIPLKEWLSSFNTDSAPICFNKIQDLKRECERDERTTKS